jgi:DNA-binding beta-propeller fold protein YncE
MLHLLLRSAFRGVFTSTGISHLEEINMRIHGYSVQRETNAPMFSPGSMTGWRKTLTAVMLMAGATAIGLAQQHDHDNPFLPLQVSTVPSNGDGNPYGLAFVPRDFPEDATISPGELLVSNFNNSTTAGLGTTIITVDPHSGKTGLFFQGNSPIGFTLALKIARAGWVFAGSLPTSGGTAEPGPLDIFDAKGHLVQHLGSGHLIDGPWGMALNDHGDRAQLFVSNVFDTKGHFAGSITRLDVLLSATGITVLDAITIASGYKSAPDTAGVVVGPAGLAYDPEDDTLYVAAEGDNAIYKLKGAGTATTNLGKGKVVYDDQTVLHGPLGLIFAPNGDLIMANADPAHFSPTPTDPSEIIEITRDGTFVRKFSIDPNPGGAFAVLVKDEDRRLGEDDQGFDSQDRFSEQFVYVDDVVSNCIIWKLAKD